MQTGTGSAANGGRHVLSSLIHSHYQWTVSKHAEPPSRRLQSKVFRHGNDSGEFLFFPQTTILCAFKSNRLPMGIKKCYLSAIIKNKTNNLRTKNMARDQSCGRYHLYLSRRFFTPHETVSRGQGVRGSGSVRMETSPLARSIDLMDVLSRWVVWAELNKLIEEFSWIF